MKDKVFADSNVLLYLLSNDERKKKIAKIILKENPVISTQVISENVNVLIKKFKELSLSQISEHAKMLSAYCVVNPVTVSTIENAFELKEKYRFQWYDCTILSSAISDECSILYSEDLQHNQIINDRLRIVNPFL
jgi:predicted nucleic acid-binding protein